MAKVVIVWDGSSATWANVFRNNPEIRAGLAQYTKIAANKNTAALQDSKVKGLKPEHGFKAVIDKADKTMLGKVVVNGSEGAKGAAMRANLPQW